MPIIQFEGPVLDKTKKEKLVKAFVEQASEILDIPKDAFVTLIKENDFDNIGNGTRLLSEKMKEK
jgi:4-oxalocrotonate tautomerase